mgnify:CR=1 FL=1
MTRYMKVYGETFEVIKPRKREVVPVYPTQWDCTDIYQAYGRPSQAKVDIWNYWKDFGIEDNEQFRIGIPFISSHNCQAFTVTANVYVDVDGYANFYGVMVVTRDHNRIYKA